MNSINVMAPINPLGYGVVGLNVSKELAKNAGVSLFPIGNPEVSTQEDASAIQSCIKNQTSFDAKAPCLRIWHQFAMAEQIGNGLRCGLPIFELDAFNENEMHHLNSLDKIFVCSDWAKEVVVENLYNLYKHINVSQDVLTKHDYSFGLHYGVAPTAIATGALTVNSHYTNAETAAKAYTIPSAAAGRAGDWISVLYIADIGNTNAHTYTTTTYTTFALGSHIVVPGEDDTRVTVVDTAVAADNVLTITGATNGDGGKGTRISKRLNNLPKPTLVAKIPKSINKKTY